MFLVLAPGHVDPARPPGPDAEVLAEVRQGGLDLGGRGPAEGQAVGLVLGLQADHALGTLIWFSCVDKELR